MDPFDHDISIQLQSLLSHKKHRIVFAESCTAGLIAASLGRIPGISDWLAGSAVVYQIETKAEWLGVDCNTLIATGPVSQVVSEQMAGGVLKITPHATIAASVTGHLGPDAPVDQDGIAWSSIAVREHDNIRITSRKLGLNPEKPNGESVSNSPIETRHRRQVECVRLVMQFCVEHLQSGS